MGRRILGFALAGVAGLTIWMTTMATVPDGEYVSSTRTMLLWVAMTTAAAGLGYVLRDDSGLLAVGLVGGPLLVAGWTAPRGDEDGLWVLFFPYLVFMGFVLALMAWLAGRLRAWLAQRLPDQTAAAHVGRPTRPLTEQVRSPKRVGKPPKTVWDASICPRSTGRSAAIGDQLP